MEKITPALLTPEIICAETPAGPNGIIVFGASGDLSHKKLIPSLSQIFGRELIGESFYVLGAGRKELSDQLFRENAREAMKKASFSLSQRTLQSFLQRLYFISGDYNDPAFYKKIEAKLIELDKTYRVDSAHIFYLAVPPFLYPSIIEQLGSAGLSCPHGIQHVEKIRLVVEKPFGRDFATATELDARIHRCFQESQIYRIDHYLGKETVQNILMLRFANTIFEPIWNRNYIDHVQITIAETVGVEHRGGYYEKAGALRDIFQNHMLQMLAMVAMEPPTSFEADRIRDEKVKLLRSIRPFDLEKLEQRIIRGQYGPGSIEGRPVCGYRQEPGIDPNSKTETYVAAKVFISNWRWSGVPFYLRTGKRLAGKDTEVAITFKKIPHSMFLAAGLEEMPPNVLVLQIQPEEGISLSFQAKRPGSKICMGTLNMSFSYASIFRIQMPEAYERLLLDCMLADQTLFARYDGVQIAWRLLSPVLEKWQKDKSMPHRYDAGAQSFPQADRLIQADNRNWRKLVQL